MTETETTIPAANIGTTGWKLTGMSEGSGGCDHCGRSLKHLYAVINPAGETMTVGRGCVKKLTGWTLNASQAAQALRSAARGVEMDRRRSIVGAECPELAAAHVELEAAARTLRAEGFDPQGAYGRVGRTVANNAALFTQATIADHLWNGSSYGTWQEYLARNL
jgi:hypothetical protein